MILALDSSTPVLSLALGKPNGAGVTWLATRELPGGGQHGAALPLAFEQLFSEAGIGQRDLTGCAVGLGPGSFTGLRVGIATLKGIAYGLSIPLAGVSSLRALALEVLRAEGGPGTARPVLAVLDARHGEIYAGLFEGPQATPAGPEMALAPAQLAERLGSQRSEVLLAGAGVAVYREQLARDFAAAQLELRWQTPKATHVGELCLPLRPFSLEAIFSLDPHYVRPSEAEIKFPDGNFKPRAE